MSDTPAQLNLVKAGFTSLKVGEKYKQQAIDFINEWITDKQFSDYQAQLNHLIDQGHWDYLLDSFHQVIPFGTGGRRGEVGIGPNRINPWTIKSSAQGHSQFLLKHYGEAAKQRGVVLAYDVREFFESKYYNPNLPNPVRNLKCKDLAKYAAEVYAANGIKVYVFDDIRTTPELSFAVRHLKAVAGDVFSASHNPPEHNGKKVYDEFGGQLIPPEDENLVREVTQNVSEIKQIDYNNAIQQGHIEVIDDKVDQAYIQEVSKLSYSNARDVKIVYTPLHGCGKTSVYKILQDLGFNVELDPLTSNPSGKFENVTFNIPNPEVIQSFETPLKHAQEINADIILSSDPDADRIGVMVRHQNQWEFLNGNEIAALLSEYVVTKTKVKDGYIIKTAVTTDLIREISQKNNVNLIGGLLVGFKYIGEEMNKLESKGLSDKFLFGCEESHGYIAGNYVRDKDAAIAALWLAELAAELKQQNKTLVDYLQAIYAKYGYFRNYLTEIRLPGAEGKSEIDSIQASLRNNPPTHFETFEVDKMEDYQDRTPIVSETDNLSKNVIAFHLKPIPGTISIKITVRPSGTEPKIKMYFEIGSQPFDIKDISHVAKAMDQVRQDIEKTFMKYCYKLIGVDFPDRGFLLFWQLPLQAKLTYFEIEPEVEALKSEPDSKIRQQKLDNLLQFLGSDAIHKVDDAFREKNGQTIKAYLEL